MRRMKKENKKVNLLELPVIYLIFVFIMFHSLSNSFCKRISSIDMSSRAFNIIIYLICLAYCSFQAIIKEKINEQKHMMLCFGPVTEFYSLGGRTTWDKRKSNHKHLLFITLPFSPLAGVGTMVYNFVFKHRRVALIMFAAALIALYWQLNNETTYELKA